MKWMKEIDEKFAKYLPTNITIKILIITLIIYFISSTWHLYMGLFSIIELIVGPFFIGFIIAYILEPVVLVMEKYHIRKQISIPLIYILIIVLFFYLLFAIVPTTYNSFIDFINSIMNGINELVDLVVKLTKESPSPVMKNILEQVNSSFKNAIDFLPAISNIIPNFFNSFLAFITNALFSITISVYYLADFSKVKNNIRKFLSRFRPEISDLLVLIDDEIGAYVRALVILMIIKFIEYSLLYFFIGNDAWLILGLLTSIGLLIPYFGPMLANCIGIITSITLGQSQLVILIAMITVLSTVDGYLIAPLVHLKRVNIPPLWTLFCVFTGGVIFGVFGIIFSIPIYMALRTIYRFYFKKNDYQLEK